MSKWIPGWPEPVFEKPPVYFNGTGTAYVDPRDILLSERGQREIAKMLKVKAATP